MNLLNKYVKVHASMLLILNEYKKAVYNEDINTLENIVSNIDILKLDTFNTLFDLAF